MNKFVATFALAIVAVCAVSANPITGADDVASEAVKSPNNLEEIADLKVNAIGFSDFCLSYRDYVMNEIKTNADVARLFSIKNKEGENKSPANIIQSIPTGTVRKACEVIKSLSRELPSRFESAKEELVAHNSGYEKVELGDIECATVKRINRLDGFCDFSKAAGAAHW